MSENKFLAWIGIVLFAVALALLLLLLVAGPVLPASLTKHINVDIVLLVIAGIALIAVILGFLTFKRIQGKVASGGGLVVFLLATGLFLTTLSSRSPTTPASTTPSAARRQ